MTPLDERAAPPAAPREGTPPGQRRRLAAQALSRARTLLSTQAFFARAYGNVGSSIYHALGVPRSARGGSLRAMDAKMADAEHQAEESLAEAQALGRELGERGVAIVVGARALGRAIVDRAVETGAGVILLGSAPRWRAPVALLPAGGRLRPAPRTVPGGCRRLSSARARRRART